MKWWKRILRWFVWGFFSLLVLIYAGPLFMLTRGFLLNQYAIKGIQKDLLADEAGVIAQQTRFGLLYGNGNHCDLEILLAHQETFPAAKKGFVPLEDFFEAPCFTPEHNLECASVYNFYQTYQAPDTQLSIYFELWRDDHPGYWDLRCH